MIFIHIPKNAGTSIEDIAKEHDIGWGRFEDLPLYNDSKINCSFWHNPEPERVYNRPAFCVVRNPYSRIISEYRYSTKDRNRSTKRFNDFIRNMFKELTSDPYKFDCHWVPQTYYTRKCDHVLKFENLVDDFGKLMRLYNLPLKMEKATNVSKGLNFTVQDISRVNLDTINRY